MNLMGMNIIKRPSRNHTLGGHDSNKGVYLNTSERNRQAEKDRWRNRE